jgi:hypothetical protein
VGFVQAAADQAAEAASLAWAVRTAAEAFQASFQEEVAPASRASSVAAPLGAVPS